MNDKFAIETQDLTKNYGKATVVDHLNFHVKENEVFGLLGPNGAGKTTTILMLLGLTEPASGTVKVLGFNPNREPLKVKRLTGYLPESVGFYEDLTARENLEFIADLNHINLTVTNQRIDELLKVVGLEKEKNKTVGQFSRGMKQRLSIARVLLHDPKVLLLDEPASGLDPRARIEIRELLKELKKMGKTILISSHILPEIQAMADEVAIIAAGRLVRAGHLDRLLGESGEVRLRVAPADVASKLAGKHVVTAAPGGSYQAGPVKVTAVAAYNTDKDFHPKANGWVGYVVTLSNGQRIYHSGDSDVTPEMMGERAQKFVSMGARIVGGCCGSTPEHVAAIARAVKGN